MTYDLTRSSDRQSGPEIQVRHRRATAGPGGGEALGCGASATLPSTFLPIELAPAATTYSGVRKEQTLKARYGARFAALIATLASLERKSLLLRLVGVVPVLDIEAASDVPTPTRPAERKALRTPHPSATAQSPPPGTRVPVVLLPHAHHGPSLQQQADRDHAAAPVSAARQWHEAELAMKVARHSFDRWLTASDQDPHSVANMHAHHTRTAVHEAARAIATLLDTLDAEAPELTTPAQVTREPLSNGRCR